MEPALSGQPPKPVLWVFRDAANTWRVHQEGETREPAFDTRRDALEFSRLIGAAAGGYKLYFELKDGAFSCEYLNYG